ncbi:glycosyltransferase family 9 protein [Methylomusa anaerophila]|nr:glycosyltransferase family 9 protein [Methylomusa anaerophila]
MRFLIIRLSSIGDVLHSTPVARALKTALPACHITWLVGEVPAELLFYNPFIDDVYVWPRERWEKALRSGDFGEAWRLWRQLQVDLRGKNFDAVLDIHGLFLTGMIAAASGVRRRIGMSGAREMNYLFMSETATGTADSRHFILRYLSVLKPLGIHTTDAQMNLFLSAEAVSFAEEFLQFNGVKKNKCLITINPSTTWPAKNWPAEHFVSVINRLGEQAQVLLCGGPSDRKLADEIIRQVEVPLIDAVGRTNLLQMAALLSRSTILLTGDTGPLHMAVALNVPTVSIFGATDPAVYGPFTGPHVVLRASTECSPCNKRKCPRQDVACMRSVSPDSVIREIGIILKNLAYNGAGRM